MPNSRDGQRMGNWTMVDSMINDGLWDVYNQYHMGITAQKTWPVSTASAARARCLALASQQKLRPRQGRGQVQGRNRAGAIPKKGDPIVFDADEFQPVRPLPTSAGWFAPAFDKAGSVTGRQCLWHQR